MIQVVISKFADKQLRRVPSYIVNALYEWKEDVELNGLEKARKIPGYHDEPLKGQRAGQRSIRLNRAYRAIYEVHENEITLICVMEVSKHEY